MTQELETLINAAENGDMWAQCELGNTYCMGTPGDVDYVKGREWYLRAAEQGNSVAMGNLGLIYYNGYGVDEDKEKSFDYFLQAAEHGNVLAMEQVANMYQEGCGVEPNAKEAGFWKFRAKSQKLYDENYEAIQAGLSEGKKLMDTQDYSRAEKQYIEVLRLIPDPQVVYKETAYVLTALGDIYEREEGYLAALRSYQEAYQVYAGRNNPYIPYMIGKCFYKLKNVEEATKFFKISYENSGQQFFAQDDNRYMELIQ